MSGLLNTKLFYYSFLLLIFFYSCKINRIDEKDYKSIKIAYLPRGLNPNMEISNCNDIFSHSELLRDTIITNEIFIEKFISCVNKLKKSPILHNADFRIICLLKNEKKQEIKVCLGEDNYTMLNDTLMVDNKELFKLVNNVVYGNSINYLP